MVQAALVTDGIISYAIITYEHSKIAALIAAFGIILPESSFGFSSGNEGMSLTLQELPLENMEHINIFRIDGWWL